MPMSAKLLYDQYVVSFSPSYLLDSHAQYPFSLDMAHSERSTPGHTPRHPRRLLTTELLADADVFLTLFIKIFAQQVKTFRICSFRDFGARNGNHAWVRLCFSITFVYVLIMDHETYTQVMQWRQVYSRSLESPRCLHRSRRQRTSPQTPQLGTQAPEH